MFHVYILPRIRARENPQGKAIAEVNTMFFSVDVP
jgi:hypothetical protein